MGKTEMMEKYYTPTIEEFHVGFEYECSHDGEWVEEIVHNDSFMSYFDGQLKDGNVRVKYLDESDIFELLGEGHSYNGFGEMDNRGHKVFAFANYPTIQLITYSDGFVRIQKEVDKKSEQIFYGIIKNKSELNFQLKTLKVIL